MSGATASAALVGTAATTAGVAGATTTAAATTGLIGSGGLIAGVVAPSTLATLGSLAMTGLGTVSQMNAQAASGKSAAALAEYTAKQSEVNAIQERAAAGRTAKEQRRMGDIAISNAIAAGASSGGAITDPSIMGIIGKIADESEYRAASAMYQGASAARGYEAKSATSRYEGSSAKQAAGMASTNALFGGITGGVKTLKELYG